MAHAAFDRAFDQRPRVHGVVAVVAERIGDRLGHHDRAGEVNDRVDAVFLDQRGDQGLIADVADLELGARRHRPREPGGQIVEHHHGLAGVDERVDHVAADVAGAAGNQDRHAVIPFGLSHRSSRNLMKIPLVRTCTACRPMASGRAGHRHVTLFTLIGRELC